MTMIFTTVRQIFRGGIIGLSDENEMCTFMMKTVPKMRRSIYHPDPSLLLQYFVLIKICSLLIVLSDAL